MYVLSCVCLFSLIFSIFFLYGARASDSCLMLDYVRVIKVRIIIIVIIIIIVNCCCCFVAIIHCVSKKFPPFNSS